MFDLLLSTENYIFLINNAQPVEQIKISKNQSQNAVYWQETVCSFLT